MVALAGALRLPSAAHAAAVADRPAGRRRACQHAARGPRRATRPRGSLVNGPSAWPWACTSRPHVMREVVRLATVAGAGAILFAIILGASGSWLLRRMTDTDETTSFFAMAIGGASEMATQAQRYGGRVDRVAAAHSLRIMLVVLIVPLFVQPGCEVHGLDPYVPLARSFDPVGFAVLVAVTLGAAVAMERFGSPNSWMIGPLLAAAAITATGHTFSSLPAVVVNAGQLLIGISLGIALHAGVLPRRTALSCRWWR